MSNNLWEILLIHARALDSFHNLLLKKITLMKLCSKPGTEKFTGVIIRKWLQGSAISTHFQSQRPSFFDCYCWEMCIFLGLHLLGSFECDRPSWWLINRDLEETWTNIKDQSQAPCGELKSRWTGDPWPQDD